MKTGGLLLGLGWLCYVVFSVLPDGSTTVLSFPWVSIWQAGLLFMAIACVLRLWQTKYEFYWLGNGLDWGALLVVVAIALSTAMAQYPGYALWYALTALGFVASLYAVHNYLHSVKDWQGVWRIQGLLSVAVALESLFLWLWQVLFPKLQSIAELNSKYGLGATFDFGDLVNRNGEPFSHPNYTAGYLLLSLPIWVSLAVLDKGKLRWLWLGGIAIGLVDLFTTSSRGGWLGLVVWLLCATVGLWWQGRLNRLVVLLGSGGAIAAVAVLIALNTRLRNLIATLGTGGGELLYRMVTSYAGWRMGWDHWLAGAGLGAGGLMYQKYRPHSWAQNEAPVLFQLHSTPVQLWAELGLVGILAVLVCLCLWVWLFVRLHRSESWRRDQRDRTFTYSIFSALLAYGVMAITDYQLDVLAIAGFLVLLLATLAFIAQKHLGASSLPTGQLRLWFNGIVTVWLLSAVAWLLPVHASWQNASIGFLNMATAYSNLREGKTEAGLAELDKFRQRLTTAHNLASWNPYYAYQLGWNLANVGLEYRQLPNAQELRKEGLQWLERSIAINPFQEFPYGNSAALLMDQGDFSRAIPYLQQAIALTPQKRSLHFMLGLSLLYNNSNAKPNPLVLPKPNPQRAQAIRAIAQELVKNPLVITNPLWSSSPWRNFLSQTILPEVAKIAQANPNPKLQRSLAVMRWWLNQPNSLAELQKLNYSTTNLIVQVARQQFKPPRNPSSAAELVFTAFYQRQNRLALLAKAYVFANGEAPYGAIPELLQTMARSMDNFDNPADWLRQPLSPDSPLLANYRVGGGSGFNIIHRNIDGMTPFDFWGIQESAIASLLFDDLFPKADWFAED
jgi:O-antigen ligase/tetratricopeptide (TPR) repeat protein